MRCSDSCRCAVFSIGKIEMFSAIEKIVEKAGVTAVFRHQRQARLDGGIRAVRVDHLAVERDVAAVAFTCAKNGFHQLAAARANQPGKAEDFALAQLKTDIAHAAIFRAELVHREHGAGPGLSRGIGPAVGNFAAHHGGHQFVGGGGAGVIGAHITAIFQHRNTVTHNRNFFELVRDVDQADALGLQLLNHLEQMRHFFIGERGGGFVHDDDAGVAGQRLAISTCCFFRNRQITHQHGRMPLQANAAHRFLRLVANGDAVDHGQAPLFCRWADCR